MTKLSSKQNQTEKIQHKLQHKLLIWRKHFTNLSKEPKFFLGLSFLLLAITIAFLTYAFPIVYTYLYPPQTTSTCPLVKQKLSQKNYQDLKYSLPSIPKKLDFSQLELAVSPEEQERGLMYRKDLCRTCGMLFVYPDEAYRSFWMKNTYVSLDMIFIGRTGEILSIYQQTEPLSLESKSALAMYVLEVPANFSAEQQLQVGQYLDIEYLLQQGRSYQFFENTNPDSVDEKSQIQQIQ